MLDTNNKYLICVDDTDMPGTKGTGWLVQAMCKKLEAENLGSCSPISRHQLYVHEQIPFTSHNSAMCFALSAGPDRIDNLVGFMADFLENRSEPGSDPGLCVARLDPGLDREGLMAFGRAAKSTVLTKSQAYDLARTAGIHLSEHGGTGCGVIGAVAGIGLRLTGNDGRYRGWYHLGWPGDVVRVKALCSQPFIQDLVTDAGEVLSPETRVHIGSEKTKTVRLGSRQVVVVKANDICPDSGLSYRTLTKQEAKAY